MHQLYILDTEWPTGEVRNVEAAVLVDDFAEALRIVRKDLEKNATAEFTTKCMTDFVNNRFVHLPNGKGDDVTQGVMILFIPEIPL